MRGIDVSIHNGDVNMQAVKDAGYDFVIIRADSLQIKYIDDILPPAPHNVSSTVFSGQRLILIFRIDPDNAGLVHNH